MREWEAEGKHTPESEPITIEQACERFMADAEARKLNEATIYKYKLLFRQLEAFADERGLVFPGALDLNALTAFRAGWRDGPRSAAKKLERLRAFLHFAEKRKWMESNPASGQGQPSPHDAVHARGDD